MGERYEYEAPGFIKHIAILLYDRVLGTATQVTWIRDKQTDARVAVDELSSDLLEAFGNALDKYAALPKHARMKVIDRMFDMAADAIFERQRGNRAPFDHLMMHSPTDWERLCDEVLAES